MNAGTINATCTARIESVDEIRGMLRRNVAVEMDAVTFVQFLQQHGDDYWDGQVKDWEYVLGLAVDVVSFTPAFMPLAEHEITALARADHCILSRVLAAKRGSAKLEDADGVQSPVEHERAYAIADGYHFSSSDPMGADGRHVTVRFHGAGMPLLAELAHRELFGLLDYCRERLAGREAVPPTECSVRLDPRNRYQLFVTLRLPMLRRSWADVYFFDALDRDDDALPDEPSQPGSTEEGDGAKGVEEQPFPGRRGTEAVLPWRDAVTFILGHRERFAVDWGTVAPAVASKLAGIPFAFREPSDDRVRSIFGNPDTSFEDTASLMWDAVENTSQDMSFGAEGVQAHMYRAPNAEVFGRAKAAMATLMEALRLGTQAGPAVVMNPALDGCEVEINLSNRNYAYLNLRLPKVPESCEVGFIIYSPRRFPHQPSEPQAE